MTVDVTNWDILDKFKSVDGEIITDKGEINEVLFKHKLETPSKLPPAEMQSIIRGVKKARAEGMLAHINAVKNEMRSIEERITRANENLVAHLQAYTEQSEKLSLLRGNPKDAFSTKEIEKILQDPFWKFEGVDANAGVVSVSTSVDCVMRHTEHEYDLNFGRFKVSLNLVKPKISVHALSGNIYFNGHTSPYVGSSGSVCWGTRQFDYAEWMRTGIYSEAFQVLKTLLTKV